MRNAIVKTCISLSAGILLGAFGVGAVQAQQSGIKRTVLMKHALSAQGHDAVMGHAELGVGMETGMHTHPGEERGYVEEGEMTLHVDGKQARALKAGDTFSIAPGLAHNAKATGTAAAKVLAVYVVEKNKPLAPPTK